MTTCPECRAVVTGGMLVPRTEQDAVVHHGEEPARPGQTIDGVTLTPCLHSRWHGDGEFREFMAAFHALVGVRPPPRP